MQAQYNFETIVCKYSYGCITDLSLLFYGNQNVLPPGLMRLYLQVKLLPCRRYVYLNESLIPTSHPRAIVPCEPSQSGKNQRGWGWSWMGCSNSVPRVIEQIVISQLGLKGVVQARNLNTPNSDHIAKYNLHEVTFSCRNRGNNV